MIGRQPAKEVKRVYLMPDIPGDDRILPAEYRGVYKKIEESIAFQYWPDSITDTKDSSREEKRIPGLSGPLYWWTSGGPRTISFTAMFSRDEEGLDDQGNEIKSDTADQLLNVDVTAAIKWLRSFQHPSYSQDFEVVLPPPNLWLVMPGTGIAFDGSDEMLCFLAGCDVTNSAWFPSGRQRFAEASLTFNEVLGSTYEAIKPQNRSDLIPQFVGKYKMGVNELSDYSFQNKSAKRTTPIF
jgi:hypothetical protein